MRGFTLIEIVVAFAILSLGLGITMQIASSAMRNTRVAAERTEAALYAKSLLDIAGVGERLEEGETSGDFDERFRWRLDVSQFEVETDAGLPSGNEPVNLYRLELLVSWGKAPREREARFVTLRALTPDTGQGR
jgi:general secretion pathway protein I